MAPLLRNLAGGLRQALFPPDPGLMRTTAASRATLGGLLALALTMAAETALPMGVSARVLAFAVATFLGALVRDTGRLRQAVTIALSPLPVFAVLALTALALTRPPLPDLLAVLVVFAAMCAASCGPRWAALGAVSLMALLIGLLTRVTLDQLPGRLLLLIIAAVSAASVRFLILPERPGAELRRLRYAICAALAGVLDEIAAALRRGQWRSNDRRRLRRATLRLNEAVMLVQPRLPPGPALHLLELDLLAERMARVALVDLGATAQRPVLMNQIAAFRPAVLAGTPPPPVAGTGGGDCRLGVLLGAMGELLRNPVPETPVAPPPRPPPPPDRLPWATLEVRPAVQAALATALAIAGGELADPGRWYYAVFAAFAVFQGTRSRGESVAKAVAMMGGSVAGVVAGLLVASLLAGHHLLSMACIAAGLFLAFCASTAAYGVMIFWLTVILGLVFGMLGYFPRALLLIRLQETAVGAAAGMAVACLVLARPTPNLIRRCAADFLLALGDVVQASARPLLGQPADPGLGGLLLTLEQRFQAFRGAAAARIPGARLLGAERTRRLALLLAACEDWARELVRLTLHLPQTARPDLAATVAPTLERIGDSLAALTAALAQQPVPPPPAGPEPPVTASIPARYDPASRAARLLLRLDGALLHMRQALGAAAARPKSTARAGPMLAAGEGEAG